MTSGGVTSVIVIVSFRGAAVVILSFKGAAIVNLIVSFRGAAKNTFYLKKVGVSHVLNTAEGETSGTVDTSESFYKPFGIKYKGLRLLDVAQTNISLHFNEVQSEKVIRTIVEFNMQQIQPSLTNGPNKFRLSFVELSSFGFC